MIRYKIDVLEALRKAGYSSYRIRQGKLLGESTLQKLRNGKLLSWHELDKICGLLNCEPWDLIEYVPGAGDIPEDASRG